MKKLSTAFLGALLACILHAPPAAACTAVEDAADPVVVPELPCDNDNRPCPAGPERAEATPLAGTPLRLSWTAPNDYDATPDGGYFSHPHELFTRVVVDDGSQVVLDVIVPAFAYATIEQGVAYDPVTSYLLTHGLPEGSYTLRVRAVDVEKASGDPSVLFPSELASAAGTLIDYRDFPIASDAASFSFVIAPAPTPTATTTSTPEAPSANAPSAAGTTATATPAPETTPATAAGQDSSASSTKASKDPAGEPDTLVGGCHAAGIDFGAALFVLVALASRRIRGRRAVDR